MWQVFFKIGQTSVISPNTQGMGLWGKLVLL
jgi:hypothetical protein